MEDANMSLADFIKKNKVGARISDRPVKSAPGRSGPAKAPGVRAINKKTPPKRVIDARDVICSKNRTKIVDAREKLNQIMRNSDARVRLQKRAKEASRTAGPANGGAGGRAGGRGGARGGMSYAPTNHDDERDTFISMGTFLDYIEHNQAKKPFPPMANPLALNRTVHNEGYSLPTSMPPLPHFRTVRSNPDDKLRPHGPPSPVDWSDPFQLYDMRLTRPNLHPKRVSMPDVVLPYEPASPMARPPRGILRTRSGSPPRPPTSSHAVNHPQLSSTMQARLERAPNPSESMGLFAKLPPNDPPYTPQYKQHHSKPLPSKPQPPPTAMYRSQSSAISPPSPPTMGYRIVVSNLHCNVIQQDIQELFEDIGDLLEARLVRQGVAEVIYRTLKDAEKAVDAYHNRQLDGQPMNCLLVKPRAFNKPTAPAIKYGR